MASATTYSRVPMPLSPASVTPAMIITADDAVTKSPKSSTPSPRIMNGTDTAVSSIPATYVAETSAPPRMTRSPASGVSSTSTGGSPPGVGSEVAVTAR